MQRIKIKQIAPFLILLLALNACRKEKSYWGDDFVAPIAHGGLTLANLFPDTLIKSNPNDSSLKLSFQSILINFGLDSLLKIPDTTTFVKDTMPVPPPTYIPITPSETMFSVDVSNPSQAENYYNFPNGIQLKKAIIRSGTVQIKMENTVRQPIDYHYQLSSATKNGHILDTVFHIPSGDPISGSLNNPGVLTATLDLSGYTIDFTGISYNKYNTLIETYTVSVSASAQPLDTIFFRQGFASYFSFKGIIPQYAVGYFGNQTINVGPDTTSFNIFNTIKSGMLNLNSAKINLRIDNEFGVAMRATINSLSSISTANSQTVTLNSSNSTPLASPLNINAALNTGTGSSSLPKTITINNINTPSLTNFIGILPNKLAYKLTAQINPGVNPNQSLGNDFGYYGTAFKAYMDADIPLYFSASNLILADTVAFNISGVNQLKNINRGQLILTATNSYPFSINLQGYLLDENKQVIDVLFNTPNTIQAPQLDVNFKVIAPQQSKLTIPLAPDKIVKMQKAKYIYYKSTFNTASQPNQIKFYNYYNLDLLLTADVNYSIGK